MPRRPKAPDDLRSFILHVRFTPQQRDLLVFAAEHEERELSDWVRRSVLKDAARIKEQAEARGSRRTEDHVRAGSRRVIR
jgi:uncharacterized protein (DUF1778 family)